MKILIVCSSNVCRSPYAEFELKRMVEASPKLSENVEWVKSSAVFNKSKVISPKTAKCLLNEGFTKGEIDSFKPSFKCDEKLTFSNADVIIGMTKSHKFFTPKKYREKFITLSEAAYGKYEPIPDPFLEKDFAKYQEDMAVIKKALKIYASNLEKGFSAV